MSAINEWFGYYNAVFTHIKEKYGDDELDLYFDYLVKNAYDDIIPTYREGGLPAIAERYVTNFKKDGDEGSARSVISDNALKIEIKCPAFYNSPKVSHPDKNVGEFFCSCCRRLNSKILNDAGYSLEVTGACGDCVFKITREQD